MAIAALASGYATVPNKTFFIFPPYGCSSIFSTGSPLSLWPEIVATEHMTQLVEDMSAEDRQNSGIGSCYNWEIPLLTGRVIAALVAGPQILSRTGRVQIVAELAQYYGFLDQDNQRPASLRSLKFILPNSTPALRKYHRLVPNIKVPWWALLLSLLKVPRI